MTKRRRLTPEQIQRDRDASRDRQRAYRARKRKEAAERGDQLGRRLYRWVCPICGEPLVTQDGRRRHMEAVHPGEAVTIEGRRAAVLEACADEGLTRDELP